MARAFDFCVVHHASNDQRANGIDVAGSDICRGS